MRAGRLGRLGRPARCLLASLALLVALAPAAPAEARRRAQAGAPSMQLRDRTAWVGDGTDFVLTVQIDGAPAGATIRISVHDRVRSRSEFARTLMGQSLRTTRHRSAAVPIADIDPEGDGLVTVGVPLVAREGIEAVSLPQAGVYPVVLEVLDGDEQVAVLRTYLVRLPPFDADREALPLDVVVVLPIHAPPAHLAVASPSPPDVPLAGVVGALSAHPGVALTVAPTPETVDAVAVTDPVTTSALVATLGQRQVLAGPWVDLDEAAWARADEDELDRQLDRGRRALVDVLGADPDDLRLAPAGATAATAGVLAETGASGVVLAADELPPLDTDDFPFTLTRPFALDVDGDAGEATLPALVTDAQLVAEAATAADDPMLAAANLLADLAVLASDQPALRRVATVVLPAPAARSGEFLDALLGGLEPPPAPPPPVAVPTDPTDPSTAVTPEPIPAPAAVLVGRTAADALAEVEPAGARGEPDPDRPLVRALPAVPPPPDIGSTARALDRARADLVSFRATFGTDDPLDEELDLLLSTAAAAELSGAERNAALHAHEQAIDAQLAGLHAPESQTVRLTARDGQIQLLLQNDTGKPAQVTLVLRGDRLVLADAPDGRLSVQLADEQTRVDLRVEARSSGDAPLDIVVMTPDERVELGRSRITVRATAVSGVGVLLLGASAAFLVVWWTRTIVRERRAARGRHPAHAKGSHAEGAAS